MDLRVAGKGYLIVGGTAGMGLATARCLAEDGARVAIAGRDAGRAAAAAAALATETGAEITAVTGDVTSTDDANGIVGAAVESFGGLDGVAVLTGLAGHVPLDSPDEAWLGAFDDVLMGTVRILRAAVPHLIARGEGTIVTTSAYSIRDPKADRLPYGALKSGVALMTKAIAKTYGPQGIRANCVAPGAIETEALAAMRTHIAAAKGIPHDQALERVMVEDWGMTVALGRPGRPNEVGELMAFLLSPRAGYLTGALINIDGGTDF